MGWRPDSDAYPVYANVPDRPDSLAAPVYNNGDFRPDSLAHEVTEARFRADVEASTGHHQSRRSAQVHLPPSVQQWQEEIDDYTRTLDQVAERSVDSSFAERIHATRRLMQRFDSIGWTAAVLDFLPMLEACSYEVTLLDHTAAS